MSRPADFNTGVVEEFRANAGRVGGPFAGTPLLLLTTTGARTGAAHTTPLVCHVEADRVLVFASKGGAPTHPAWYHNLVADPVVTVELGTETYRARAVEVTGPERDALYRQQAERVPAFEEYQRRTERRIPVIALERLEPGG